MCWLLMVLNVLLVINHFSNTFIDRGQALDELRKVYHMDAKIMTIVSSQGPP